jgi:hypothetical protein
VILRVCGIPHSHADISIVMSNLRA